MKNTRKAVNGNPNQSLFIKRGECFFRTYRAYFESLADNARSFKEIMVERLSREVDGVYRAINTGAAFPKFYLTNYATGTSAFLKRIEKNAPPGMYVKYLDCEAIGVREAFSEINKTILAQIDKFAASSTQIVNFAYCLIIKRLLEISNFKNKEYVDNNNDLHISFCGDNGQLVISGDGSGCATTKVQLVGGNKVVILLDHIDRYFITGFHRKIKDDENGIESDCQFALNNINLLRKCWYLAVWKLNEQGIQCIASALTDLEEYLGKRPREENLIDAAGRTKVSSEWRLLRKVEGEDAFFYSLKENTEVDSEDVTCYPNLWHKYAKCRFRLDNCFICCNDSDKTKKDRVIKKLRGVLNAATVEIFDGNLWLMCCSFHHAFKDFETADLGCQRMDANLKSYYKNENERRAESDEHGRSLLEDYLFALPLYLAEIIPYDDQKTIKKIEYSWESISSRLYKNVIDLLEKYARRYDKLEKLAKPYDGQSRKKVQSKERAQIDKRGAWIRETNVTKTLTHHLYFGLWGKVVNFWGEIDKEKLKECFANIIVQRDIFSRTLGDKKKRKYYAQPFMHYLYSDKEIFSKECT